MSAGRRCTHVISMLGAMTQLAATTVSVFLDMKETESTAQVRVVYFCYIALIGVIYSVLASLYTSFVCSQNI